MTWLAEVIDSVEKPLCVESVVRFTQSTGEPVLLGTDVDDLRAFLTEVGASAEANADGNVVYLDKRFQHTGLADVQAQAADFSSKVDTYVTTRRAVQQAAVDVVVGTRLSLGSA